MRSLSAQAAITPVRLGAMLAIFSALGACSSSGFGSHTPAPTADAPPAAPSAPTAPNPTDPANFVQSVPFTVTGLPKGTTVTVALNGANWEILSTDGSYYFGAGTPAGFDGLAVGVAYTVSVSSSTGSTTCVASQNTGVIADTPPSAASISCKSTPQYVASATPVHALSVGTPAPAPSAREGAASFTDINGNWWLFGGEVYANGQLKSLKDLWMRDAISGMWQELGSGAPAARAHAATWRDSQGNFWLFGGQSVSAQGEISLLSDLWTYNASSGEWKEVPAAAGAPGARKDSGTWVDASGNLWLAGGTDSSGQTLGDDWRFNPHDRTWTQSGSPSQ
jgi:Galactose oxidase, central domain